MVEGEGGGGDSKTGKRRRKRGDGGEVAGASGMSFEARSDAVMMSSYMSGLPSSTRESSTD